MMMNFIGNLSPKLRGDLPLDFSFKLDQINILTIFDKFLINTISS